MNHRFTAALLPVLVFAVSASPGEARAQAGDIALTDITEAAGITYRHDNGRQGDWQYPEIVGGGCGMLDFDSDGRLDLVFIQSGAVPRNPADADAPDRSGGGSRLYRNVTPEGDGAVRFVDVTTDAGLEAHGYGMGVATGDFTGDGHVDLYITNFGPNTLWRNDGNGGLTDITAEAGVGDPGFSTSAAAGDVDRDGDLDLYVVNYVAYDPAVNPECYAPSTRRDYCGPAVFAPEADTLYLNEGGGRFREAGDRLDGGDPKRGLGVVIADLDGDHWPDIYVANDGDANLFWRNRGGGRFEEYAWPSGLAVNRDGQMEAGMGVAAADFDGDGRLDLFLTHLTGESNTLYRNRGEALFEDETAALGLAAPSLPHTGFGTGAADLDLDGWPDLFVANGAVRVIETRRGEDPAYPLQEPDLVFRNRGGEGFENVTGPLREALGPPAVGRGAAFGDVNNDGRPDLLVCNSHDAPRLYRNDGARGRAWLGARLTTGDPPRDAIGAIAAILRDGEPGPLRRVATDGSYLSASDPRVVFGLGDDAAEELDLLVTWPDGSRERFPAVPTNAYTTLQQGEGEAPGNTE